MTPAVTSPIFTQPIHSGRVLAEIDDQTYQRQREEIRSALAKLDAEEPPSIKRARRMLADVQDFPWQQAKPEQQASVIQSMVEAFFVSPTTDRIVAVAPQPELRTYMQDRIYVKRTASGWTVQPDGSPDYTAPDDWSIDFVQTVDDVNSGVAMARSEGFEPPTPGSEDLSRSPQALMFGHV